MSSIKNSQYMFNEKTEIEHVPEKQEEKRSYSWFGGIPEYYTIPAHDKKTFTHSSLPSITFTCDMCKEFMTYISKDDFKDIYKLGYWDLDEHFCGDCLQELHLEAKLRHAKYDRLTKKLCGE